MPKLVASLAALGLVACSAITGIGDLERESCVGTCGDDGGAVGDDAHPGGDGAPADAFAGGDSGDAALVDAAIPCTVDPVWQPAASPLGTYHFHSATLLSNGKVLLAGSGNPNPTIAEVYDPASNSWTNTNAMNVARTQHAAAPLLSGKVLVCGGRDVGNVGLAATELYDPPTNLWASASPMAIARSHHTATLLQSGKVLVAGGLGAYDGGVPYLASVELYNPTTNTWTSPQAMTTARGQGHTATLLQSGKVLVAGGFNSATGTQSSAELYDPTSNTWASGGTMTTPREGHTAVLLANGNVLVGGGGLASYDLYDALSNSWTSAMAMSAASSGASATLLPHGKVLMAGGSGASILASATLYDPVSNMWTATRAMTYGRYDHTATLLPNGNVLVAGGFNGAGGFSTTAERWVSCL